MTAAPDIAQSVAREQAQLVAEVREVDMLLGSTEGEINRLRAREQQARSRLDQARADPGSAEVLVAADDHGAAIARRVAMEGQLEQLRSKRQLLDRVQALLDLVRQQLEEAPPPEPAEPGRAEPGRILRAIVDTQEEERRRIARQVHDGPAQAMANVVLQSEISERAFSIDPQRARQELAALRTMVNKTLQELRGFIFELRPMILDDLGLVPTLRRYAETLVEKHGIELDLSSTGRDRRLPPEDEVSVFRLLQDSLIERIERGGAKRIALAMDWRDETLELALASDGRELLEEPELASGLRRSERLGLLRGSSSQEAPPDGGVSLRIQVPIRPASALIT